MNFRKHRLDGFTLVELLVVIGIISLLISILLPALQKARRSANTIACSANLRSIIQGMQLYASQNNGYIPGSVQTTAQFMVNDPRAQPPGLNALYSNTNCPSVVCDSDWESPLAHVMGIKFDEGGSVTSREARFTFLNNFNGFRCPENLTPYIQFGTTFPSPWTPTGFIPSYNIASVFTWGYNNGLSGNTSLTSTSSPGASTINVSGPWYNPPQGYTPKVTKVGPASAKIYIADGSRFTNATSAPDISFSYTGSGGAVYGGIGPFSSFDNAWNRALAPGNAGVGNIDCRVLWARHGAQKPNLPSDQYRFNAGFFDGHVETLGDLEGSDPSYWVPTGTAVYATVTGGFPSATTAGPEVWNDVKAKYFSGARTDAHGTFIIAK